eukprot:7529790-Lingulodinium_polyedra.AAC.1
MPGEGPFGGCGGACPHRWMIGRPRPSFDGEYRPPVDGDDASVPEEQLATRNIVANLFHQVDERFTITSVATARNRIVVESEIGALLYYRRKQGRP